LARRHRILECAFKDSGRPGRKKKNQREISYDEYEALKRELDRKDKARADFALELTILKKKVSRE